MSAEAIIGIAFAALGFMGTIVTIVYQAGQLREKIESFGKGFEAHVAEDDKKFALLFEKSDKNREDIAEVRGHIGHNSIHGVHGAHGE